MARASIPTLLSLDRYAQVMGISPMSMAGGTVPDTEPVIFPGGKCSELWFQYDWQGNDRVSRENLAQEIHNAEEDISRLVGFFPAPKWIEADRKQYTKPFDVTLLGMAIGADYNAKSIKTSYGKVVSMGRRAVTLLDTVAPQILNEDSDGFAETIRITVSGIDSSITDACKIKVFFEGYGGAEEWEIRPAKKKTLSGGTFVADFPSWLFINPDIWEAYPTSDGYEAFNANDPTSIVLEVEVYYEYSDLSQASIEFLWERSAVSCNCATEICSHLTQDGCAEIRDNELGLIVPLPGTYDATTLTWGATTFSNSCEPTMVDAYYYAGDRSQPFIAGKSCDPLSYYWAQTIAYLATARLDRPLCNCGRLDDLVEKLQADLMFSTPERTAFVPPELLSNPLGSRYGEVWAWRRIHHMVKKVLGVAVI